MVYVIHATTRNYRVPKEQGRKRNPEINVDDDLWEKNNLKKYEEELQSSLVRTKMYKRVEM